VGVRSRSYSSHDERRRREERWLGRRDVVTQLLEQDRRVLGCRHAVRVYIAQQDVLDRDGYAVEGPQLLLACQGFLGPLCLPQRLLRRNQHEAVERGIEPFYSPQVELDQLDRGQLLLADKRSQLRGRDEHQFLAVASQPLTFLWRRHRPRYVRLPHPPAYIVMDLFTLSPGAYRVGNEDLASVAGLPRLLPGRPRSNAWDFHGWPRGT
jgi:hypothetical protein